VNDIKIRGYLLVVLCFLVTLSNTAFASERSERKSIETYIASFNGRVGIYAENLKSGKKFKFNENEIFPTASTSKLVVSLAGYKYLYPSASAELKDIYDDNIYWMIHTSDNDAFYDLLDDIAIKSPNALQKTVADLGLKRTKIHNEEAFQKYGYHSITTPREMAEVFRAIDKGKYLGKSRTAILEDELADTIFHDEIPRFMQTKVMHKVGELDNVLCDVGIVDDGKDRILMSIYIDSDADAESKSDMIAFTAAKLYNLLRRH
jgi:beta-lactamase class A